MSVSDITIHLNTANGPVVEYSADDDAEAVEAALPSGWAVDWETPAVKTTAGRYRAPLMALARDYDGEGNPVDPHADDESVSCECRETYPQLIPGRVSHGPGCHHA